MENVIRTYGVKLFLMLIFFISINCSVNAVSEEENNSTDTLNLKQLFETMKENEMNFLHQENIDLYNKYQNQIRSQNDSALIARVIRRVALSHYYLANYNKSIEAHLDVISYSLERLDKEMLLKAFNTIGVAYMDQGNYSKALNYYLQGLEFCPKDQNCIYKPEILYNIGNVYSRQVRPNEARKYYEEALHFADSILQKYIYTAFVNMELTAGNLNAADSILRNHIDNQTGDSLMLAWYNECVGDVLYYNGEVDSSLQAYTKAEEIYQAVNWKQGLISVYFRLLVYYDEMGSKQLATNYAKYVFDLSKQLGWINELKYAALYLSEYYERTGDIVNAHNYLKVYNENQQKLLDYENERMITELSLQRKYSDVLFDIRLEKENERLLKDKQLEQEKLFRRYFLVAFIMVLLLIVVLYYVYYQKRLSNLEIKQLVETNIDQHEELKAVDDELKRNNSLFDKRNEELRKINATKDRFFNIIANDLKKPFGRLLELVQAMKNNAENDNKVLLKDKLNELHQISKKSFDLLENLLHWSRSQTGTIKIEKVYFSIDNVVKQSLEHFELQIIHKKLNIDVDDNYLGKKVFADKNILTVVVKNILNNAIKFSPDYGHIKIGTKLKGDNLILFIADNGPGIPEAIQSSLFKIDSSLPEMKTTSEGTGIGLLICYEYMHLNNGDIWFESLEGKGATFFISIPI